jgi:hypothetical protein
MQQDMQAFCQDSTPKHFMVWFPMQRSHKQQHQVDCMHAMKNCRLTQHKLTVVS